MPDLTANAATFRAGKYRHTGYLSIVSQTVVLSRAVNMATITYPVTTITFDDPYSGGGATADVQEGMTVIVYSQNTPTVKGKLRVANGGASATVLQVSEFASGVVNLADNDKFEVVREWRIWDKLVSATAALNKDSRIAYTDQGSNPFPVCISGGPVVGFISGASLAATFYGSESYVTDPDSVSAITHSWNFGDGTPGSDTVANPSATFPAGFRWITHTITDPDNSKTALQRVPVWAHERTGSNAPLAVQMEGRTYSHQSGWSARFRLPKGSESDVSTLPDGCFVVYWEEETYDASQTSYGSNVSNRSHIKFVGYLLSDTITIDPQTNEVTFEAASPLEILNRTPALPQLLLRDQTPANWQEVKTLTINRAFWYLWHWGASADIIFDFLWLSGTDLAYSRLAVDNIESVGGQLRDIAASINTLVTCDKLGRLYFKRDPNYLSSADRAGLTTTYNLLTSDITGLDITRQHRGVNKFVRGEGITAGTTVAAQKAVFANAPGNAPAWMGPATENLSKQIVSNQADLNTRAGMHFARINGLYNGLFVPQDANLTLPDGYDWIDPAYLEWVTLTLAASTNKRGVSFSTATRWLLQSADISYDIEAGTKDIRAVADHETIGPAAVTYTPPKDNGLPGYTPPSIYFPSFDFTAPFTGLNPGTGSLAVFATDGIAVTTNFSATEPNWTWHSSASLSITGQIEDFTVDAFSPRYLGTGTAVNGWLVSTTDIYRITDIFGSIAAASQFTFATPLGNTQAKNSSRSIQTERGQQNWVVVASWYSSSDGLAKTGSYVTETTDGTNWDVEAALTTTGDDGGGGNTLYHVAAVYVSGKAANTAYSAAVDNGAAPSTFIGYKTVNGGSSWATFSNPAVNGNGMPGVIHVPWQQAADTIMYYGSGYWNGTITTDRTWRATGTTRTDISPTSGGRKMRPMFNHGIHTCDANRLLTAIAAMYGGVIGDAGAGATFVSRNGGDVWTLVRTPDTFASRDAVVSIGGDGNTLYLLSVDGKVRYSTDFGTTIVDKTGDLGSSTTARLTNLCGG